MIYEYFRVTGANDSVENYADLFTIVLIKWLVLESEPEEVPARWVDEYGRTWLAMAGWPRRWWLFPEELVVWDEPGWAAAAAAGERGGHVFKVFSQDTVLQRFVEQIFTARFVEQNHVAWVWWYRSPDIISTSPLLRHFAHVSCDSSRRLLEKFLHNFNVKVDTDSEADSPVAL